jgi:NADPH:quinone reductase-like Zn-dependent oxidoreductase
MKAVSYDRYGGPEVLRLGTVDIPTPKAGEVLVRVKAVGLNAYDWHVLRGKPCLVRPLQGLFRPKNRILGSDIAGIVEAVGDETTVQVGDEVFGCLEGTGRSGLAAGGLAQFVAARESGLKLKPEGLTFEQAAALPMAGGTALIAVRDSGRVKAGMKVLINGAAGGVGTFAVQIAKALGAQVTGVCSTNHVELVSGIGADQAIDYTSQDFTSQGESYDVIIDVAASRSVTDLRRALKPGGVIVSVGFSNLRHLAGVALAILNKKSNKRVAMLAADNWNSDHVRVLAEMTVQGQIQPVIDRSYPIDQTADAFRYLEQGHPAGKVIVLI